MTYLLKATVAWTVFLLLFELFYKNNRKFTVNRFYLLFSVAAGLLLPLISLPSNVPAVVLATHAFYPALLNSAPQAVTTASTAAVAAPATATAVTKSLDAWQIVWIIYVAGITLLTLKFLLESGRIINLILRGPSEVIAGHKVIVTGKKHAPYSFMGWIFISDLHTYQPAELEYIIDHEAAHNHKKHWLDLLLLQLACIALWFHPLIWRYRYLLQLQHEYEADDLAAHHDVYTYGHFLLQQTLLNGVPSIAHSFHFSPIKNRIKMLTKKQDQRPGAWKYLLVVPALLGCTFLIAKAGDKTERAPQSNVTTYKGNTFTWRKTDTLFYDAQEKRAALAPPDVTKTIVSGMNGEPVYQNEYLSSPATYLNEDRSYFDYLRKEYLKLCKNSQDSATYANISNIVINKEGKIVFYNIRYSRPYLRGLNTSGELNPFPEKDLILNGIIDKIIAESPAWKPAVIHGKAVNSVVNNSGGC